MSLFESMAANAILIDFSREPVFDSDQVYLCAPSRFPIVTFALYTTIPLCRAADQIRKEAGHPPMLPTEEDEAGDSCVWYDFSIGINGFSSTPLDSVIAFAQGPAAQLFGEEAAADMLAKNLARKEQGAKYCGCEACTAASELLAKFGRIEL